MFSGHTRHDIGTKRGSQRLLELRLGDALPPCGALRADLPHDALPRSKRAPHVSKGPDSSSTARRILDWTQPKRISSAIYGYYIYNIIYIYVNIQLYVHIYIILYRCLYNHIHSTCICSSVAHHPPPGHGHGLPPSPRPVDLWWFVDGRACWLMES